MIKALFSRKKAPKEAASAPPPKRNNKPGASSQFEAAVTAKSSGDAASVAVASQVAAAPVQAAIGKKKRKFSIFPYDPPGDRPLKHPEVEKQRFDRMIRRVKFQAFLLVVVVFAFLAGVVIFKPANEYYARRIGAPVGSEKKLAELNVPVLTKQAILSWAMTAVTEIMTFNFANYNERITMYIGNFHPDGWKSYLESLVKNDVINRFKSNQLVVTAAPSAAPEIVSEGENPETFEYEWKVKIPIILTYVTNNNKTQVVRRTVNLTLVRVSTIDSVQGIAIRVWREQ